MDTKVIIVSNISKRYYKVQVETWNFIKAVRNFFSWSGRQLSGKPSLQKDKLENEFWALRDVSFEVHKGQRLGIIGMNGAGKSTLLKILSRLVYPTEGEVRIRGRVTSLLEVGTGFNMSLSGRENIYLNASLHGLHKNEIEKIFNAIVDFSGVGEFLDMKVKYYSSGMYMRLAFSVAAHLDSDILLMDEVLAVGDLAFQKKCLQRVENLAMGGRTIIFVSHSLGDVARFCDHLIWMDKGKIKYSGDVTNGIAMYQENLSPQRSIKLSDRADRGGTGSVKINCFQILDNYKRQKLSVKTGDEIYLVFDYSFEIGQYRKVNDVFVCVIIENEKRQRLFGLPSEVIDIDMTNLLPNGKFACHIEKLPLVPGTYFLTVSVLIDHQLVDKIVDAAILTVLDGDYYGTGRLPLRSFGEVCIDFSWSLSS